MAWLSIVVAVLGDHLQYYQCSARWGFFPTLFSLHRPHPSLSSPSDIQFKFLRFDWCSWRDHWDLQICWATRTWFRGKSLNCTILTDWAWESPDKPAISVSGICPVRYHVSHMYATYICRLHTWKDTQACSPSCCGSLVFVTVTHVFLGGKNQSCLRLQANICHIWHTSFPFSPPPPPSDNMARKRWTTKYHMWLLNISFQNHNH